MEVRLRLSKRAAIKSIEKSKQWPLACVIMPRGEVFGRVEAMAREVFEESRVAAVLLLLVVVVTSEH